MTRYNPVVRAAVHVWLLFLALLTLAPFYWMASGSFRQQEELFAQRSFFPAAPTLGNYPRLLLTTEFPRWFLNSAIISVGIVTLGLFFCSLAGFAFAKYRFRGRDLLFLLLLGSVAVPPVVTFIPLFWLVSVLSLMNSYPAVILPASVPAFGIFFMRQYLQSVPSELLDAGRIDGCHELDLYWRIVLPVVRPGLAALTIYLWLHSWSAYLWPTIVLRTRDMFTFPLGLAALFGDPWFIDYGMIMAGATLATLPVIAVFFLMQEHFVAGLTGAAVKG